MDAQEVIADVVQRYSYDGDAAMWCKSNENPPVVWFDSKAHADLDATECILDALEAEGFAVVRLPGPVVDAYTDRRWWPVVQHWNGHPVRDGEVWIRKSDGRITASSASNPSDCTEDARSLAAAILAAADAAEKARKLAELATQAADAVEKAEQ